MSTITCDAGMALCELGGLDMGENEVDDMWDQELNPLVFGDADLSTFTMEEVEVPAGESSTTWLYWAGTEVSRELVPTPACGCG
jgi:hypothetical protein